MTPRDYAAEDQLKKKDPLTEELRTSAGQLFFCSRPTGVNSDFRGLRCKFFSIPAVTYLLSFEAHFVTTIY